MPQQTEHQRTAAPLFPLFFFLAAIFLTGCSHENHEPAEQAKHLRAEAVRFEAQEQFVSAEKLYAQIVPLDRQLGSAVILAADLSTLARLQSLNGNFSSALSNFNDALAQYQLLGDQSSQLHTMLALGHVNLMLDQLPDAIHWYQESLTFAKLFLDTLGVAQANEELGEALKFSRRFTASIHYYDTAFKAYTSRSDSAGMLRTLTQLGTCWAALHANDESRDAFSEASEIARALNRPLTTAHFLYDYGTGMELLEQWSDAVRLFDNGIQLLNSIPSASSQNNKLIVHLFEACGEVYKHNFAFQLAKENFVQAYTVARKDNDKIAIGYLLLAIADCERKSAAINHSQVAEINAENFYEQALTFFVRVGNISGEAATTYRLALMKEGEGNSGAALALYKRVFDLRFSELGEYRNLADDAPFYNLGNSENDFAVPRSSETFWYRRLVSMLVKLGHYNEALAYFEKGKSKTQWTDLQSLSFSFADPPLNNAVRSFQIKLENLRAKEIEFSYQHALDAGQRDAQQFNALQNAITADTASVNAIAADLSARYPQKEILFRPPVINPDELRSSLDDNTAVIDYFFADDAVMIFVISNQGVSTSVVPVIPERIAEKMRLYQFMVKEKIFQIGTGLGESIDLDALSHQLYAVLIKPVEYALHRQIIIIPPQTQERFPFHALFSSEIRNEPLIARFDVSYVPFLALVKTIPPLPRSVNSVAAIGDPRGKNFPLDLELRNIQNVFRKTSIVFGHTATGHALFNATGDVLQLATEFDTDSSNSLRQTFVLSSGDISSPGIDVPVSALCQTFSFPIVYLFDQEQDENGLEPLHALLCFINGSSMVIENLMPVGTSERKLFSEKFYSSLSHYAPNDAYRSAINAFLTTQNYSSVYQWAPYFKFGK